MTTFACPRRMNEIGPWKREEGLDRWETGHGLVGRQQQIESSCSFCGSLHPDTFMAWIAAGAEVGPTDKNYKAYIRCPHPDPREGETRTYTTDYGGEGMEVYGVTAKFYFQHLSDAQQDELVRLLNAQQIRFGYPGRFYRLPYFVRTEPAVDAPQVAQRPTRGAR